MNAINIYTDGACSGNPGPGGIGVVLTYNGHEKEISQGYFYTTNNRMELRAAMEGLKSLKYDNSVVTLTTDSKYVSDAFNKGWIYNWEQEYFAKRKNADLWVEMLTLVRKHQVTFKWVKGHEGNHYNERCDQLAVKAYKDKNFIDDIVVDIHDNGMQQMELF